MWDEKTKSKVLELYKTGDTCIDIAKKLAPCRWTIAIWINKAGLMRSVSNQQKVSHPTRKLSKEEIERRTATRRKNGWYPSESAKHMANKRRLAARRSIGWFKSEETRISYRKKMKALKSRPDGKTELRRQINNHYFYKEWRKNVLKKNDYTCQVCGKRGGKLHAHHVDKIVNILRRHGISNVIQAEVCDELWDISNGQTMCYECHIRGGIHAA